MQVFLIADRNDRARMDGSAEGGLPKPQPRVKMKLERAFENYRSPALPASSLRDARRLDNPRPGKAANPRQPL